MFIISFVFVRGQDWYGTGGGGFIHPPHMPIPVPPSATKEHQVQEKDVHHVAGRTSAHTPSESPHEVVSSKSSEADHPSHGSSGTPQESKPVMVLSDKELNALGAKLIKAEMLGMKDQYEKLKKEIEEARKARELVGAAACPDGSQRGSREEVVILTRTDSRGFSHPLSEPAEEVQKHRRKTKVMTVLRF